MAASEAAKEAVYLKRFLSELGLHDAESPVSLSCDNQAAVDTAYNPENHERMKHVERRHFFVRERVQDGQLLVPFVRTHDNMADFFTKVVSPAQFAHMRDVIMNCDSKQSRALRLSASRGTRLPRAGGRYESDASDGSTGSSHTRDGSLISHTACIAIDTKVQTESPELSVDVASIVAKGPTQLI